jgi:DNA mismatch repair protein MutH
MTPCVGAQMAPSALVAERSAALVARAEALSGRTLADISRDLGLAAPGTGAHHKGRVGALIERALGASAGSWAGPDFPDLGIELKTVPVSEQGRPFESTFVCTVSLASAERADWETSVARSKLSRVLWVPIIGHPARPAEERRVGVSRLVRLTPEQEAALCEDFDEIMGRIGIGGIEDISARVGRFLQLRPKARTGADRTISFGPDGEWIGTVPRGLYLRARFTEAVLRDPAAMP